MGSIRQTVGGVGCVEISNSTTPKMVTFSEEAVAAYDMLVNKRHGVESKMTWEASSSFTGNGDKWNSTSSAEETYSPPWVPQLEVAGHRGGLVAGSARQGQVWNTLLGAVVPASFLMPPWVTTKEKEHLSIQTRTKRGLPLGQTKKARVP